MKIRRMTLVFGALMLGTRLAAQEPVLQARLDAATYRSVSVLLDSARVAGIPTQSLVSKALEGASKGASGERIVAALRRLSGELAAARGALGVESSAAEIDAGATVLHIGVEPRQLASLRAARPHQSLTIPLGMMADLVARGVPTDSAGVVVLALARAKMRDEDFVAFRRNVERDIALGAPPAAAASVRVTFTTRDAVPSGFQSEVSPPRPRKP